MEKTINELINSDYREYSEYTIQNRALPSNVDGMKPVQRKILFSMLGTKGKKKVAEIGSSLASFGYHHGEASAQAAVVKMGQDWSNNIPLIKGHGNFGSVLVQEASAPRYIFGELSTIVEHLFKDTDLAPAQEDPEDPEPELFLPIIPYALVNGISGIAVGFATNIMPHDPLSIIDACRASLRGAKHNPVVKCPSFKGTIEVEGNRYTFRGSVRQTKALEYEVTELPVGYDRLKYVSTLESLVEKDVISDYEDHCSEDGFNFKIKVNRQQKQKIEAKGAEETLKLISNQTQNIVMVDHMSENRSFVYQTEDIPEYIKDFVAFRLGFYEKRIKRDIEVLEERIRFATEKMNFITYVIEDKNSMVVLRQKKADAKKALTKKFKEEYLDRLISLPLYSLTEESYKALEQDINKSLTELEELKSTDPKKLYDKELGELRKKLC